MNMPIQIGLQGSDPQEALRLIDVAMILPHTGDLLLDRIEHVVVEASHQLIRSAVAQCLEAFSKEKAVGACRTYGGTLTRNAAPYRVDGELGRVFLCRLWRREILTFHFRS